MSSDLDPNGIAYRDEILHTLWKIGKVTRPIDSDKQGIYADCFEGEKLTRAQLGDMLHACVKGVKVSFFPTPAKLLEFARPPGVNQAPSGGHRSEDPITGLEREIAVQTAWMRKFEKDGNDHGARMARIEVGRAQDAVNRRLLARDCPPRYVAVGVEVFGSDARSGAGTPTQLDVNDWTRETED